MPKKILVTGAAGFIGFHLTQGLSLRGDLVVGYDNFNTYYDPSLKRQRQAILSESGQAVYEGDLGNLLLLENLIEKHHITHIVHLAAQAGVRYSLENPQAYLKSNLDGFLNILELCRKHPHLKLTYASSSSVYGLNTKIPFAEGDKTDQPASFYGATKKSNELMAHSYHHLFGIPVTGLRFFTVYGPWGRPDMAYMLFADAITQGKPIKVFNHGLMKRDFTYISDIVEGIAAAVDLESPCEVFNLGNHRPVELNRFIEILENLLGKKALKEFFPLQPGDVLETYADISHSQAKLGFFPKVRLEEGLAHFVSWYKNYFHF